MKTVLVTGANGYIGKHVVAALNNMNVHVIAADVNPYVGDDADETISANILDPEFSPSNYLSCVPDVCLHLAWRNGFNHNSETHIADLSGHYGFLLKMADYGVKHLAVMGSMHEVGYWEGAICDDTPCNPQSLYGIAKDCLRRTMFQEASLKGFNLQWLRGYYIFGDDEGSQSVFGKLLRAARSGETTFPFTTGKNKFDFSSVKDLAYMISCAVLQDEINGIINCCSGNPVSLAAQMEQFIKDNELNISLEYGAFPDRPYDSPGVWGNADKINAIMASRNC